MLEADNVQRGVLSSKQAKPVVCGVYLLSGAAFVSLCRALDRVARHCSQTLSEICTKNYRMDNALNVRKLIKK